MVPRGNPLEGAPQRKTGTVSSQPFSAQPFPFLLRNQTPSWWFANSGLLLHGFTFMYVLLLSKATCNFFLCTLNIVCTLLYVLLWFTANRRIQAITCAQGMNCNFNLGQASLTSPGSCWPCSLPLTLSHACNQASQSDATWSRRLIGALARIPMAAVSMTTVSPCYRPVWLRQHPQPKAACPHPATTHSLVRWGFN